MEEINDARVGWYRVVPGQQQIARLGHSHESNEEHGTSRHNPRPIKRHQFKQRRWKCLSSTESKHATHTHLRRQLQPQHPHGQPSLWTGIVQLRAGVSGDTKAIDKQSPRELNQEKSYRYQRWYPVSDEKGKSKGQIYSIEVESWRWWCLWARFWPASPSRDMWDRGSSPEPYRPISTSAILPPQDDLRHRPLPIVAEKAKVKHSWRPPCWALRSENRKWTNNHKFRQRISSIFNQKTVRSQKAFKGKECPDKYKPRESDQMSYKYIILKKIN